MATKKLEELAEKYHLKDFYVSVNRSWVDGFVRGRFGVCFQDIDSGYTNNKHDELVMFHKGAGKAVPVALYSPKRKVMYFKVS
jgi:hypothetical protein